MATIQMRANGTYTVKIRRKGFPFLSRTFRVFSDAETWAAEQESAIDERVSAAVDVEHRQRIAEGSAPKYRIFADLIRRYLNEVTSGKRSVDTESDRINGILKHSLAACPIAGLTRQRVAQWRDERLSKVSGSTVNRDINLLRHVIAVAMSEWGVPFEHNPFDNLRSPKNSRPRDRRLHYGEETVLLQACAGSNSKFLSPVVELAIETAMRQGELVSLQWSLIDFTQPYAKLPVTKNGDARIVPLSSRALAILAKLKLAASDSLEKSDNVFPGVTAEAVKRAFIRTRKRAGILDLRFHDLRREATSRLFEKGMTVPEVAAITGHKTWSVLRRYTHLRARDLARRLDQPAKLTAGAQTIEELLAQVARIVRSDKVDD
ncbi:site-specific integrase [Robbsia sp. KACC 23696]|uniref:tyrosine-type recombinase/integrase n=1 Tax=Robbsia sp. KACC 23696 TaxID=3149231 RepID=UPI00325BADE7